MTLLTLFLRLIGLVTTALIFNHSYKLYTNYQQARRTQLRILISPFDPIGVTFLILSAYLGPLLSTMRWARVINPTWSWQDNFKNHEKLGSSFIVVTPEKNVLYSADAGVVEQVLGKRKVWVKPAVYGKLNFCSKRGSAKVQLFQPTVWSVAVLVKSGH
jgi:hypothetical protein